MSKKAKEDDGKCFKTRSKCALQTSIRIYKCESVNVWLNSQSNTFYFHFVFCSCCHNP